jgi:hypothetical protein
LKEWLTQGLISPSKLYGNFSNRSDDYEII